MQFDGNSMTDAGLINRLDALLPQTQCRRCGYAACRPYAEAMAAGKAGANQCPPGGDTLARALAIELGIDYAPLDRKYGEHSLAAVARIDEASCIGCTLCIKACPVDAIVGAAKYMHTVITAACTGCGHWHAGLALSDKTFTCPRCGLCVDRQMAGARNNLLAAYGRALGVGWDGQRG